MNRRQFYKNILLGTGLVFYPAFSEPQTREYSLICSTIEVKRDVDDKIKLLVFKDSENHYVFSTDGNFKDTSYLFENKYVKCKSFDCSLLIPRQDINISGPYEPLCDITPAEIKIKLDFEIYV